MSPVPDSPHATYHLFVHREVEVKVDESKFTPEFMAAFRFSFYPFWSVKDHVHHIATCVASGLVNRPDEFLEGYGLLRDFGVSFKIKNTWIDD